MKSKHVRGSRRTFRFYPALAVLLSVLLMVSTFIPSFAQENDPPHPLCSRI